MQNINDLEKPTLRCPCGFLHNLGSFPDEGWTTVRGFFDMLEANFFDILKADEKSQLLGLLYECPTCGRIMWGKPGDSKFTVYERVPNS